MVKEKPLSGLCIGAAPNNVVATNAIVKDYTNNPRVANIFRNYRELRLSFLLVDGHFHKF